MKNLTFITGNPSKAKYLGEYFKLPVLHKSIDLPEIQSMDLDKIVAEKAREAYKIVKAPVLVEDVSLTFIAMGQLPGPLIKWFLNTMGNEGMCKLVSKYKDRKAVADLAYCIFDGKNLQIFKGQTKGSIATKPKGKTTFGWDPIFIPDGYKKTWAEMTQEEKDKTSMRKKAAVKLKKYLINR
jgi:non-canonical purine NTP pyrophosphatase (RdgB/HAM1 family)